MDYNDILTIFYDTISELLDVGSNNEKDIFESLRLSYHTRHNFVHAMASFMLTGTLKYAIEKKASYYFPNLSDGVSKLTPDMILFFDRYMSHVTDLNKAVVIIVFDISVSSTSNLQSISKENKYQDLTKNITEVTGIPSSVYPIAINSNLTNLEVVLQRLCVDFEPGNSVEIPYSDIRLFFSALQNCQQKLKSMINNEELVDKYFKMEFGQEEIEKDENFNENMYERINVLYETYINLTTRKNDSTAELLNELVKKMEIEDNQSAQEKHQYEKQLFANACDTFKEALDDPEILQKFKEKETVTSKIKDSVEILKAKSKSMQTKKIKPSHQLYTPLLFTPLETRPFMQTICDDGSLRLEQRQILDILTAFNLVVDEDNPAICFINNMFNTMKSVLTNEHKDINIKIFNENLYFSEETDTDLKQKYHHYRDQCIKTNSPMKSFNTYLTTVLKISAPLDNESRCYKQKMVKIPSDKHPDLSKKWWEKAHSGFRKDKKMRIIDEESSLNFDHSKHGERILNLFTQPTTFTLASDIEDVLKTTTTTDAPLLCNEKTNFINDYMPIWNEISYTVGFNYLYKQSQVAEQLMHFTQFSLPSNTYSFFTAGSPNLLYIVSNSYHNKGKDVGKAYMICGFTDSKSWDNPFFGEVEFLPIKQGDKDYYLFYTNWRRTETFKLTFLKDQFYSIMSTAMNALLRHKKHILGYKRIRREHDYTHSLIKHHLSLKVMVGLTSNQRIAEMLADLRYAIMASFSEYSEVDKLIVDKFSPKYSTVMEAWIASRTENIWKQVHDFKDLGLKSTFFKQPVYINKKRKDDSIGGRFEIPSIWTGVIIEDLQDLLDDMFLYVHTLKEPSNIHHENVKAMRTIIEYQQKYDKLTKERKQGKYKEFSDFKKFILDDNPIGHHSDIVRVSTKRTMQGLKAFDLNLHSKKHFFEPISQITSTKAAIPEYEREIIPLAKLKTNKSKKKKMKKILEEREFITEYGKYKQSILREREKTSIKTSVTKESFLPATNRSKVHDCILDVLENNLDMSTIFDLAEWNIKSNSARVVSDICIKAQYGAKREFYVINVGAKSNARILENIFSEICKVIPNEMISVPGDKKMFMMQDFLNDCLATKKSNQRVFFVNGDCTKWSAAETMECFMSLISGLVGFLDITIIKYLLIVVDMWSNKEITVPQSILQNTFFTIDGLTDFLKKETLTFKSTQNFLQGMFNYMSSFKAVCSSNFTRDIWKQIYPESKLSMEHLEHSDDYSLIITTESLEELQKFRALHRMVMKTHGFNDSIKKTNTQQFLMEFISLVSLNGHMTYPHIKKLKECGMNLGCTGYRDDMDTAMSRIGEAVRVGSILSSCYFMEKMHLINLMKSYSVMKTQRNSIALTIEDQYKLPIEVYGIPDLHPIILFLSKGMANNYRLYHYGKKDKIRIKMKGRVVEIKLLDILKYLTKIELILSKNIDYTTINDFTEGLRLYHPHYSFDVENNLIKKIRNNVKIEFNDAIAFWDNHTSYNFIKPKNRPLLITWMRSMYFKNNFALAYSRNSRSQITLRLSTFTSKTCCILTPELIEEQHRTGLTDWVYNIIEDIDEGKNTFITNKLKHELPNDITNTEILAVLERTVLNCDSTISTIYSFLENSFMFDIGSHDRSTVASLTPVKLNWLNLNNPPDSLIQYIFNYDDFLKDKRKNKGLSSLESDKKIICESYSQDLNEKTPITTVKSVYTDIILSQPKRNLCMTYSTQILNIEDFLRVHLEFGSIYNKRRSVISSGATESINPHTGEVFYQKFRTFTRNEFRVLIDDMVLVYALTKMMYKISDDMVKRVIMNLEIGSLQDFEHFGVREKLTSRKFIENYNLQEMKILNFTNSELKSFAFIRAYVTGDLNQLLEIINQDFIYTYQYLHVDSQLQDICKEIVEFEYQHQTFKAIRLKNPTESILVLSDSPKKSTLTDAMLIARKLFNKIRLLDLERNFGTVPLRSMQEIENGQADKEWFSANRKLIECMFDVHGIISTCEIDEKGFNRFKRIDTKEEIMSIFKKDTKQLFYVSNHFTTSITGPREFVNRKLNINWETGVIMVGKRKLFSLPVLGSQQSNHTDANRDILLNGISLNWWLKASRIEKLIKRDKLPINKDDFELFTGVEILDNKKLLGIEINNAVHVLDQLPSKMLKTLPDEMQNIIEERLYKPNHFVIGEDAQTIKRSMKKQKKGDTYNDSKKIGQVNRDLKSNNTKDEYHEAESKKENFIPSSMNDELDDLLADFDMEMNFKPKEIEESSISQHAYLEPQIKLTEDESKNLEFEKTQTYEEMMMELDEIDLDNIVFKQLDDTEMQEVEDEVIRQLEHESGSSGSNQINKDIFLDFDEFQHFEAQNITENVIFSSSQSRTKTILESIGNPSTYIIKNNYIDSHTLDLVPTKEKLGLLFRLNEILQCVVGITDLELLLAITLAVEILKSITKNEEWLIRDDFVLRLDDHTNKLGVFLKYEGLLDDIQKRGLKDKGGYIKRQKVVKLDDGTKVRQSVRSFVTATLKQEEFEEYALIPLTESRLKELLDTCIEGFTIETFLNINILKNCYHRLFKEPFVRTGFALELLNELLF